MNPSDLNGIRLKLRRAWNQLDGLKAEIGAFNQSDFYRPTIEFNRDTQLVTLGVHIERHPPPIWGVQIGEIIHNLRSALDHVVWELFILYNHQEPTRGKNQFPIFDIKAGFENTGVKQFLKGIDTKAISLIRSEQAFPQNEGGRGDGVDSPLWHLNELSNCDKHRTLHLTASFLEMFDFSFPPVDRTLVARKKVIRSPGPIDSDTVLAQVHLEGCTEWPFSDNKIDCKLRMDVAFDRRTPAVGGWLVLATLVNIADRTEQVIRRITEQIFGWEL